MTDATLEQTPPAPPKARGTGGFPYATWGPVLAIGATVGALVIGLLIALPFIAIDGSESTDDFALGTIVGIQLCTALGFLVVPFMVASAGGGKPLDALGRLGFRRFRTGTAAKWIGLGILSYLVFAWIYAAIVGAPEQDDIAGDFGPLPLQILLIVIAAPIAEEVCFRGMLFGGIRTRLPMWAAALAAGAVFGLLHYSTGWSTVPQLIALGTILAVVYEKSDSIWAPITMHAINNSVALAVLNS
jgi:membrane protease YdiL (CAAX protease family)